MAKKKKGGGSGIAVALSSTQPVNIPTFDVIPTVAAGRHPWFYLEDGTIVLKVGYPRASPFISVTDFRNLGRSKPSSSRFTDIFSRSTHQHSKICGP